METKLKLVYKILRWGLALFFSSTILVVVVYRFVPVYVTPLMVIRCVEQIADGKSLTMHHKWKPLDNISPSLPVAVMASEDQRFLLHHGFDFDAIQQAAKRNKQAAKHKYGAVQYRNRQPRMYFCGLAEVGCARDLRCISRLLLKCCGGSIVSWRFI